MQAIASRNEALAALRAQAVPRGILSAHPIFAARAEGARLWDADGRCYLDFAGGIGVLNVGHTHPEVVAAARAQLGQITHAAFQVMGYEPYVALAARLATLVGAGTAMKTLLLTTGAEAIENAVKIARAHTGRPGVIAFRGGFHGRTLLGVTLTGFSQPYRQNFGPFAPEIYHAPFPDAYRGWTAETALAALDELFTTAVLPDRVAAVIVESVQGDGGFIPAPPAFLQRLRALTSAHGIVLILDEIQSGFGRTGRLFGYQHSGIEPDLVTLAKSLAGGLPLSAVVGRAEMMDAPAPGGLGGTYAGNPVACAAALAVLDLFERDGLVERAGPLGRRLADGLARLKERHPAIGDVRGVGLMLAAEFVTDRTSRTPDPDMAQRVIEQARAGGLIVIKCGIHRNVVRLLPPLVATSDDIDAALGILDRAVAEAVG